MDNTQTNCLSSADEPFLRVHIQTREGLLVEAPDNEGSPVVDTEVGHDEQKRACPAKYALNSQDVSAKEEHDVMEARKRACPAKYALNKCAGVNVIKDVPDNQDLGVHETIEAIERACPAKYVPNKHNVALSVEDDPVIIPKRACPAKYILNRADGQCSPDNSDATMLPPRQEDGERERSPPPPKVTNELEGKRGRFLQSKLVKKPEAKECLQSIEEGTKVLCKEKGINPLVKKLGVICRPVQKVPGNATITQKTKKNNFLEWLQSRAPEKKEETATSGQELDNKEIKKQSQNNKQKKMIQRKMVDMWVKKEKNSNANVMYTIYEHDTEYDVNSTSNDVVCCRKMGDSSPSSCGSSSGGEEKKDLDLDGPERETGAVILPPSGDSSDVETVGEEKRDFVGSVVTVRDEQNAATSSRKNEAMSNAPRKKVGKVTRRGITTSTPITIGKSHFKKRKSRSRAKDLKGANRVRKKLDEGQFTELSASSNSNISEGGSHEVEFDSTGSSLREAINDGLLSGLSAQEASSYDSTKDQPSDDERACLAKYKPSKKEGTKRACPAKYTNNDYNDERACPAKYTNFTELEEERACPAKYCRPGLK